MKKDDKKATIKKMIFIAMGILLILVISLCMILFSKENIARRNISKINDLKKDYSDYIMPLNRLELTDAYTGVLSKETIYTLLYEFSLDTLPMLRNEAVENPEAFYKKNKEYIEIKTGIENFETFKALVEKIKTLPENLILSKTEIKSGSVRANLAGASGTLVIYYNDNADSVEIQINVEKYENQERTSIVFN